MEREIQVSILCLAYNHEKYIRKTLDGFIMQKGVTFEVLIHDDASTDNTAKIIKEYEQKYPNVIKPIYQTENQYSKEVRITHTYQVPRAKGKYIAFCEGDDYWTDEYKLKKQYDALETHKDCFMCCHNTKTIYEDGSETGELIQSEIIETGVISQNKMIELINKYTCYFQTSSYFLHTDMYKKYIVEAEEFRKDSDVGDLPTLLYFASKGNIYHFNETMSCYRQNSLYSWSKTVRGNNELKIRHIQKMLDMFERYEKYFNGKFSLQLIKYRYSHTLYERTKDYKKMYILLKNNKEYCTKIERIKALIKSILPKAYTFYLKAKNNGRKK